MESLADYYDVIIVGAGPAGISFAKILRELNLEAKILLVDKDKYPRDKVCGDGLCYATLSLIKEIFPDLKNDFPTKSVQHTYTLWYPNKKFIRRHHAVLDILPRKILDYELLKTIQNSSIDIAQATQVKDLLFEQSRVTGVKLHSLSKEKDIRANLVVGADGSHSIVRRKTGALNKDDSFMTVRQYIKGIPQNDDGSIFFLDPENMGYFWIFPFFKDGERWANVGYGTKKTDPRKRFLEFGEDPIVKNYLGSGEFQDKIKGFPLNVAAVTPFNRITFKRPLWGEGFVLLGDAACLGQPHTGEGISGALYSGKLAAELYARELSVDKARALYHKGLKKFTKDTAVMGETALLFKLPCLLPNPFRQALLHFIPWWTGNNH